MKKFASLLTFALVLVSAAQAEESSVAVPPPGQSEAVSTSVGASALDDLYLNYFATFHGPSLTGINSQTVDKNGRPSKQGLFLDSEITAAYMFNERTIGVGPVIPFLAYPVQGQGFVLGDLGVKAFNKKLVSASGLTVYGNIIVQAPTSDSSRDRGMTWALKTTPNVRYEVPSSRFTVGAWTEAKEYFGVKNAPGVKDIKTFKLYAAPYANYQLAKDISLNLEYEMEWHHDADEAGYLAFSSYQTDLQPGFVWNITKNVLINPYVAFYTTNNSVTADRSAIGAIISASLL